MVGTGSERRVRHRSPTRNSTSSTTSASTSYKNKSSSNARRNGQMNQGDKLLSPRVSLALIFLTLFGSLGLLLFQGRVVFSSTGQGAGGSTPGADAEFGMDPSGNLDIVMRHQHPNIATPELQKQQKEQTTITHLTLDKEVYRPGDTVFFRAVLVDPFTQKPKRLHGWSQPYAVYVDPRGSVNQVNSRPGFLNKERTIFGNSFKLPENSKGGEYTLKIKGSWRSNNTPASRKFQVRANSLTNNKLSMQLDFEKQAYAPGELVTATLAKVKRLATNTNAFNAIVQATVKIGQNQVQVSATNNLFQVNKEGSCTLEFEMPKNLEKDDAETALLTITVRDGSNIQSISKTIPIVVSELDIHVYPESGDLVAGVENQIYVESFSPATGEFADFSGNIVQVDSNKIVAKVYAAHEGRGKSDPFLVEKGKKYQLRVFEPENIITRVDLPEPRQSGALIAAGKGVFSPDEHVKVNIVGSGKKAIHVSLFKRDKALDTVVLKDVQPNVPQQVELRSPPDTSGEGVLRVTVFEGADIRKNETQKIPLAERLVFRRPMYEIETNLVVLQGVDDELISKPREAVKMQVETFLVNSVTDERVPAPAVLGIRVTDLSRITLVEQRKRAPRLPAQVYLESETESLQDAEVTFHDDQALDLLLGTQGWRRFAFHEKSELLAKGGGEHLEKLLEMWARPEKEEPKRFGDVHWKFNRAQPQMMMMRAAPMPEAAIANEAAVAGAADVQMEEMEEMEDMADDAAEAEMADNFDDVGIIEAAQIAADEEFAANDGGMDFVDAAPHGQKHQFARKKMYVEPPVRIFAHKAKKSPIRNDFQETLYWNPNLETKKDESGRFLATFEFDNSDSITTFRAYLDAQHDDGAFGKGKLDFASNLPTQVDAKLPAQMQDGDHLLAPVSIQVASSKTELVSLDFATRSMAKKSKLELEVDEAKLVSAIGLSHVNVAESTENPSNQAYHGVAKVSGQSKSARVYLPLTVSISEEEDDGEKEEIVGEGKRKKSSSSLTLDPVNSQLILSARAEKSSQLRGEENHLNVDRIIRTIKLLPQGFPIKSGSGGLITQNNRTIRKPFSLPQDVIPSSIRFWFKGFLSPIDQIVDAVQALIREPCGCFEQTSSTTYPMVLALRYLVSLNSKEPKVLALIEKARDLLRKGYERLASFETSSGGFEWFGSSPGVESLTAYGLVQFAEMSRSELGLHGVVDQRLVKRSVDWILKRRNGKGDFELNPKALDSFGRAPQKTTNAYILWSLARAKLVPWKSLEPEIGHLKELLKTKLVNDPYVTALLASILLESDVEQEYGQTLLKRLLDMQNTTSGCIKESLESNQKQAESSVDFATITSSRGLSKKIEATALSVLAFLKGGEHYLAAANAGIRCIAENAKFGTYGSTQATALSLEAIVEYTKESLSRTPTGDAKISILNAKNENDVVYSDLVHVDPEKETVFSWNYSNSQLASISDLVLEIDFQTEQDKFEIPYMLGLEFFATTPLTDPQCTLSLKTTLSHTKVTEAQALEMQVQIQNLDEESSVPMTIAKIGIPSGTEPRMEFLAEQKQVGKYQFYEVDGNFVVLYFYGFQAKETKSITIQLEASVPGKFRAPASSAYLYYQDEHKVWVPGQPLTIDPLHGFY